MDLMDQEKTVFSNYLKNLEDQKFSNCLINGFDPDRQKILVYNQRFVEENFYESEKQKGIFTLTQDNAVALKNIRDAEKEKEKLLEKLHNEEDGYSKQYSKKQKEIEELQKNTKDKTWGIKTKYTGGDRIFDLACFLDGFKNSQDVLFNHIKGYSLIEIDKTIPDIKNELSEINNNVSKIEKSNVIDHIPFVDIEKNDIFPKEITGNENNSTLTLIKELKNSSWVKKGIDEYIDLNQRD